jgi:hypothetical protein
LPMIVECFAGTPSYALEPCRDKLRFRVQGELFNLAARQDVTMIRGRRQVRTQSKNVEKDNGSEWIVVEKMCDQLVVDPRT